MVLAILIVLAVFPTFSSYYRILWLTNILTYVILTLSWSLFSGKTGYLSLATAAFFGVGMYTSAILGGDLPLLLVIFLGGIFSCILAAIIGAITLRLRGIYFLIFSFGIAELIKYVLLWYEIRFTGTRGRFVTLVDNETLYFIMLGIFVILLITVVLINRSRWGLALQSIGDYEEAASHMGVNVTALKIIIFAISSFFMGAAGSVAAMKLSYIDPYSAFDYFNSFLPALMAVFGGMGTFYGPLIGAAVFAILREYLITQHAEYYKLIIGLTLLLTIIYLPRGLMGLVEKAWRRTWGGKHADS